MPKGPKGEKRPADVIGNAVKVMRIATGELTEDKADKEAASALARLGGLKGGKARSEKLSAEKKKEIAQRAAAARWSARTR